MSVQADESSTGSKLASTILEVSSPKRLENLPPNEDSFWEGAEVHGNLVPQEVASTKEPHYFVRKTAREAQCTHCDWGFELDPGDKIKDGHLFDRKNNLVI